MSQDDVLLAKDNLGAGNLAFWFRVDVALNYETPELGRWTPVPPCDRLVSATVRRDGEATVFH